MNIGELEGLNKAESLFNITSNGKITDHHVTENTIAINNEGAAEVKSCVITFFDKDTIIFRDVARWITKKGNSHGAETTLLAILLSVLHVGKVSVGRATNDLAVKSLELGSHIVELANLGGTDPGPISRVEEKHSVFA
jgi:hypothetical protein